MKRHDFDPLSFIFGLLFLGVGLPLLFSDSGIAVLEGRWVFPAFLVVAGAIVLATTRRRDRTPEPFPDNAELESEIDSIIR